MRSRWVFAAALAVVMAGCSASGGPGDSDPVGQARRSCEADVSLKTSAENMTTDNVEAKGDGYLVQGTADGKRWTCAVRSTGDSFDTESVIEG